MPDRLTEIEGLNDYEIECAKAGRAIMAIRSIRQRTGLGLKEAKALFDRERDMRADLPNPWTTARRSDDRLTTAMRTRIAELEARLHAAEAVVEAAYDFCGRAHGNSSASTLHESLAAHDAACADEGGE